MKKLLLILLVFTSVNAYSQIVGKYVSSGLSYSSNQITYGVELGVYTNKAWYGILAETAKDVGATTYTTYLGAKFYYKVAKLHRIVDLYGFGAIKVGMIPERPAQFEIGASTVVNLSDHWALQGNLSLPKYDRVKKINPSVGLSINYFF